LSKAREFVEMSRGRRNNGKKGARVGSDLPRKGVVQSEGGVTSGRGAFEAKGDGTGVEKDAPKSRSIEDRSVTNGGDIGRSGRVTWGKSQEPEKWGRERRSADRRDDKVNPPPSRSREARRSSESAEKTFTRIQGSDRDQIAQMSEIGESPEPTDTSAERGRM